MEKTNEHRLIVIGNGFDIHHGIRSRYQDFLIWIKEESRRDIRFAFTIHQLEKFFGEDSTLWSDFEHNMGEYDIEIVANQRFGLFPEMLLIDDIDSMRDIVVASGLNYLDKLSESLTSVFSKWIANLDVTCEPDNNIHFNDSDLFLSFNYTDTLERIYGINPAHIIHIHGSVIDKENPLIVGHNHYIDPSSVIIEGNDFRDNNERIDRICEMNGLIKPCYDIISQNKSFFRGLSRISEVVIMGMSYSDIDLPYFKEIKDSIHPSALWRMGWFDDCDMAHSLKYQEELHLPDKLVMRFKF